MSTSNGSSTGIWAELKRRSVFKVGATYLVVAWLVIQVASTVTPQLNLPDWAPRLITLIALLGFPVALVLAWAFEITPEGIRVDSGTVGNRRFYGAIALAALAAVVWFATGEGGNDAASARSIAVLPFTNMSGDPNHEYFSDGISEEILNVLARTPELQVAARTSSFAYKGKAEDVTRIGRELKVHMVLEGSVRQQDQRVRITAQLIDAETGYHVWSQTYDRDLKDIFAIQDEIAKAIGHELAVRVGGEASAGQSIAGTTDLEAHDHYLRGLSLWQQRNTAGLWAAKGEFETAIAADPGYAGAYAGLALVYAILPDYSSRIAYADSYDEGRKAAVHALALDPGSVEAYAAYGAIETSSRDPLLGIALLDRAIALNPSFATAHQWRGNALVDIGRTDEAVAALQRAAELDPRSLIVANNLSAAYYTVGRYDEAVAACEPVLRFAPDSFLCPENLALAYLALGKRDLARQQLERWAELEGGGKQGEVAAFFDALEGKGDEASRKAFARRLAGTPYRAFFDPKSGYFFTDYEIPSFLVMLGEDELAIRYVVKDATESGGYLGGILIAPPLDPIRCDPRFVSTLAKLGTHDARAQKVCGAADASRRAP